MNIKFIKKSSWAVLSINDIRTFEADQIVDVSRFPTKVVSDMLEFKYAVKCDDIVKTETVQEETPETDYSKMSKEELVKVFEDKNINLPEKITKKNLIKILTEDKQNA